MRLQLRRLDLMGRILGTHAEHVATLERVRAAESDDVVAILRELERDEALFEPSTKEAITAEQARRKLVQQSPFEIVVKSVGESPSGIGPDRTRTFGEPVPYVFTEWRANDFARFNAIEGLTSVDTSVVLTDEEKAAAVILKGLEGESPARYPEHWAFDDPQLKPGLYDNGLEYVGGGKPGLLAAEAFDYLRGGRAVKVIDSDGQDHYVADLADLLKKFS
jgi:hypothetical protein